MRHSTQSSKCVADKKGEVESFCPLLFLSQAKQNKQRQGVGMQAGSVQGKQMCPEYMSQAKWKMRKVNKGKENKEEGRNGRHGGGNGKGVVGRVGAVGEGVWEEGGSAYNACAS